MNPALLRLALVGSRSSFGRLAGITAGVAAGVCLLLLLWGAAQGLGERDARAAWLRDVTAVGPVELTLTPDTLLMGSPVEVYRDQLIQRRDIAAVTPNEVQIPGIDAPPGPGEYYPSPALQQLIESTPADQLGNRFGRFIGTIDNSALPGPDSLIVISGATEAQLRQGPAAVLLSEFNTNPYGDNADTYRTVLSIGGIAVFFPVLLLISIVTNLGSAQRREQFATLHLIGASPQIVSRIAGVEAAATSLIGALLGVVLAIMLRPLAAQVPVNGTRLFVTDLETGWVMPAVIVVVVVAACALVAGYRTARAGIGPLGATRAIREPIPTVRRSVPLLTGLAAMIAAVTWGRTESVGPPLMDLLLIGGFALTAIGILVVGPWLTRLGSVIGLRRARGAAAVIAASRIRSTPVSTFRSVSGLVIAVFVVSVFAGGSSAVETTGEPAARPGLLLPDSVYATLDTAYADMVPQAAAEADARAGIQSVTIGYGRTALGDGDTMDIYIPATDAPALGFDEIPSSEILAFDASFLNSWTSEPAALAPAEVDRVDDLLPIVMVVRTDGSPEAIDRARTFLNTSGITAIPATSPQDSTAMGGTRLIQGLAVLAYLGTFTAVVIAGISLAVASAAAILDRRRVLGLMRLMGMPVAVLRQIIIREAAVPLLTVLLLSVGLGFLVAWLLVTGLSDTYAVSWPGPAYFTALGLSFLLALGAVAATFGLIRSGTAVTATRFE